MIINNDTPLYDFVNYWMEHKPFKVPEDIKNPVQFVKNAQETILYREGPFQVELIALKPNAASVPHTHPNTDTVLVYVSGDVDIKRKHKWYYHPFDIFKGKMPYPALPIAHDTVHSACTGPLGGSFLNIEKWINKAKPTFIGNDWMDEEGKTSYEESKL
jgi:mannose-6-phosphate isomerase-like protein (cupin superfamily)